MESSDLRFAKNNDFFYVHFFRCAAAETLGRLAQAVGDAQVSFN